MIFDHSGSVVSVAQMEHEQIFPRAGWVEHDPIEIWNNTREVIGERAVEGEPELRQHQGDRNHQPA